MRGVAGRIVLFGATGYTGELDGAGARRARRDAACSRRARATRVEALAAELGGLRVRGRRRRAAGDASRALVEAGDVLVSTVGPFVRWGEPAAARGDRRRRALPRLDRRAAVHPRGLRAPRRATPRRPASGLLTAFGYDYVPGNLAGALALREAGERAVSVDVGYFVGGAGRSPAAARAPPPSGMLAEPAYAFAAGGS